MDKSFIDLFENQVIKVPENTAVVFENESITYQELDKRSNRLAKYILSYKRTDEMLVPLFIERGINMIVGMLGIMKAGCAYVPIDTDFPKERISFMLEDTNAFIAVTSKRKGADLPAGADVNIVEIESVITEQEDSFTSNVGAERLAYVIYTSGSTGRPKGVMVEQRNLVDYVTGLIHKIQVNNCKSFALVSSIATDLGNTVIYGALATGGTLHLFSKESVNNTASLHEYFERNSIDCLKIVPSHWKALNDDDRLLLPKKQIIFGGEALSDKIVEAISSSGSNCQIINHYGPTETTIGKLLHVVDPGRKYDSTIPIGKPFSNTKVLILNPALKLCPIGVPGQLYITGDGLARGYLNNDDLTKQRFIPNPFIKDSISLMYATGDLVKYLPDGNVQFMGRVDDQVKIRGYRIELGEIESVIHHSELVKQAVVLGLDDKQGNKRLVAYIVAGADFDREGLLQHLREKLPDYMVPSIVIELENLPLAPNGKVDRKNLPDPEEAEQKSEGYTAPRNAIETQLAEIWQDILEVDQVGINDDFFAMGGHSLLAVRVISAIRKKLAVELPIGDIFDYPTIATLAERINDDRESEEKNVILPPVQAAIPRPDKIPLSFSQKRLWFIDKLEGSVNYHIPFVLRLQGHLNQKALEYALNEIVNRHEVLRTIYTEENGSVYQVVTDKDRWKLSIEVDLPSDEAYIQKLISKPFNLAADHMFRASLLTSDNHDHLLVATLHHIASDGWSTSILVEEIKELYNAYASGAQPGLKKLALQYADFAIWQQNYVQGEVLDEKLNYWKNKLEGLEPLQLPTDFKRPDIQSTKGSKVGFTIDKELALKLHQFSQRHGATIFMTLLGAFKVLLHRYSGQKDICVGSPIAGRQQQELESLIGFFVNTLALRSEVDGNTPFSDFLKELRDTTMDAYEHQEVPFEKVVDAVVKERTLSENPLFQALFVLRNTPVIPELKVAELLLLPEEIEQKTTLFDLTLFLTETPDGIKGVMVYCTDLYKEETIKQLTIHFRELLNSILEHPAQKIGELRMLTSDEENRLLIDFNNTNSFYPRDKSLVKLFEEQVSKTPQNTAVVFEGQELTYEDINKRSNQLAHYLVKEGIEPGTLIPICIERSVEMIVGLLGILKAGGVFVPIDPEYPIDRINYMLDDSGASLVVSSKKSRSKLNVSNVFNIIEIDGEAAYQRNHPTENLGRPISAEQLAYIIYTSGSTGKPKGVMIKHSSLVNLLTSMKDYTEFKETSSFLSVTTFSFDICYLEFYMPLISGGKLIIVPREVAIDGYALANKIAEHSPTHMQGTPSSWQLLLDAKWENKEFIKILIGGEAIKEGLKNQLTRIGTVLNLYGPTETTIWSSVKILHPQEKVVIGKPIANTAIYILNEQLQLCVPNTPGEICIAGDGLAKGYYNRDELSNQKFVQSNFCVGKASIIYKTGDLGRWLPNGDIEYLGRMDDQVKVRGYRIELGEIETVLQQNDIIDQAVVLAKENKHGDKKLVSYYVPAREALKTKEKELYLKRLEDWKEIYEIEYSTAQSENDEFDINIWKDNYKHQAIPGEHMREWLKDIVNTILSEKPANVLEIGTGTGLVYYQLSGKIEKYIGVDVSKSSIDKINRKINKSARNYGPTELHVCAAHEITSLKSTHVDTIVINSVAQYFPAEDYMNVVVDQCVEMLEDGGRLIIGDVRDNRLLESFKICLGLQKFSQSTGIDELKWLAEQEVLEEEELCFSPEYFYQLKLKYPQITHVELKWKNASYTNELSKYRYTVTIYVGGNIETLEPNWELWTDNFDTQRIIDSLQLREAIIAIKAVPNPRLFEELALSTLLQNNLVSTVGELTNLVSRESSEMLEIRRIIDIAGEQGYSLKLLLNEDPFKMDLVMELQPSGKCIRQNSDFEKVTANFVTNIPLYRDIDSSIQKDIRALLQKSLPDYMVPSEFIALEKLPLTNNGKINRKFLGQRKDKTNSALFYEAPRSEIEQLLVSIWEELLHIDRVGIYDNFFDLGGHSLMAMKVVSQIKSKLSVTVPIQSIFQFPTINKLGNYLEMIKDEDSASFEEIII